MAAVDQQLQDGDNEAEDKSPGGSPQQQRGNDSPARSSSPSGTAASTQAGGGQHQQQPSTTTSHADRGSRRDRISVGSRMTRTVIVRPPYAARDELDFERRARSGTTGTLTGSDANEKADRGGRPLGIQPPLHASTGPDATGTTRSHISSLSGTTHNDEKTHLRGDTGHDNEGRSSGQINEKSGEPGHKAAGQDAYPPSGMPTAPEQKLEANRPTMQQRQTSNDASRWLAFTLPMKYRKMLDDYKTRPDEENQAGGHHHHSLRPHHSHPEPIEDESDIDSDESSGDYHYRYFGRKRRRHGSTSHQGSEEEDATSQTRRHRNRLPRSRKSSQRRETSRPSSLNPNRPASTQNEEGLVMSHHPMSRHASTRGEAGREATGPNAPGWNSPWLPNAGADPDNDGPGLFSAISGNDNGEASPGGASKKKKEAGKFRTKTQKFRRWVVRSAFAPLAFRLLNLAFTASLLGVAVSIREISGTDGVQGIMGSSTTFAIVISALSVLHIITNLYTEYFGSPIGVWKVRSKMFYTFTELIFICLWSGLLSLAFDDLFTSPAGCTAYTPNARYRSTQVGAATTSGSLADRLCDRQSALVALVFVGLILYVLVLIVSLFRIFAKISRIQ